MAIILSRNPSAIIVQVENVRIPLAFRGDAYILKTEILRSKSHPTEKTLSKHTASFARIVSDDDLFSTIITSMEIILLY